MTLTRREELIHAAIVAAGTGHLIPVADTPGVRAALDAKQIAYEPDGDVLSAEPEVIAVAVALALDGQRAGIDALIEGNRLERLAFLAERETHLTGEQTAIDAEQADLEAL